MQQIQKLLSRYRDEIKGIAILWIVFYHAPITWSGLGYEIQKIGYGGADMTLFLMGYGLYYSLKKNSDLGEYCKRRASRLLPAYIPFCIEWIVMMLTKSYVKFNTVERIASAAGTFTMSGFFANIAYSNWYMSMLAITILLAPFFYACLKEGKRWLLRSAGLVFFLFVLGVSFIENDLYMIIARLPIVAIGMMFAHPYDEKENEINWTILLLAAGVIGLTVLYGCFTWMPDLLSGYGMLWHPFVLITPALCVGLGWLFTKVSQKSLVPLRVIGASSFEVFLFNSWFERWGIHIRGFWTRWESLWQPIYGDLQRSLGWIILAILSVVLGIAYHYVVVAAVDFLRNKAKA